MDDKSGAPPRHQRGPSLGCFAKFRMDVAKGRFATSLDETHVRLFGSDTWNYLQAAAADDVLLDFELRRTEAESYLLAAWLFVRCRRHR